MRRETFAKLALGCAGICACGGMMGISLANYAASGSFEFYRQQRVAQWQPELPPQPAIVQSTDLAFASDRRGEGADAVPEGALASLNP